ncbi:MAG: InlB B-repeat-containing protein, partial [Methanocorpusculum sp.]|nr:InlB B-repeat-containing protein [Methanocorpusculum sp.]
PQPPVGTSDSGDGNMENAFRVLFDTQGGNFISPVTYLSYGDRLTKPSDPVKDGWIFGGWYKDAACTQSWGFSDSIPGDMTLYAKWTPASGTTTTSAATTLPTAKATTAPVSTQSPGGTTATAAGTHPTLTQAPAPCAGILLGLLAAGTLFRRRE